MAIQWHAVSFYFDFPPDERHPKWFLDLLVARHVLTPIVAGRESLWRVHRRADRDDQGHRFQFLFEASPEDAQKIFEQIKASPLIEDLKAEGLLLESKFEATEREGRPDPAWPNEINKTWKYFIHGVSRMWISLLEIHLTGEYVTLESAIEDAKQADQRIAELWGKHGHSPLLHQMNAVFGYHEIELPTAQGNLRMRF